MQTTNIPEDAENIIVFTPVLHEEKNIERFLRDLFHQKYPKLHYRVIIISTQKEYLSPRSNNTIDIYNKIISTGQLRRLQMESIHYPSLEGFKTNQLEFAFDHVRKELGDDKVANTYFLFLDADSTVDPDTLNRYRESFQPGIEIYQQPLLWLKNISDLRSPWMQAFCFLQSYFSLSYELPMFTGRFFPWRLKYFVGHGLCVKGSYLIRVHGFPKVIEDVRLGRMSSFLNVPAKLIPSFGVVDAAKSLLGYWLQSSVWFFGCGLFISDYLNVLKLRPSKKMLPRDFMLLLYGFFKAGRWLNKGLFHLVGIIISLTYSNEFLVITFIISLLINSAIPVLLVARDFEGKWALQNESAWRKLSIQVTAAAFSPLLFSINFVGLYIGLLKLIKYYIWGTVSLPKTER